MSTNPPARLARILVGALVVATALGSLAACSRRDGPRRRRLPDGSRLIQKQSYQALYAHTGRLERLLHDTDQDGVAEAIVYYRRDGKPQRSELDSDGDHVIDRWETLRPDGSVSVSADDRDGDGQPDTWRHADEDGFVYRTDFDDDGDGHVDRSEYAER
jgi:hypothetical protein